MTNFPASARRVRDQSSAPRERRMRLRDCLYTFAPLGFDATWNKLAIAHRIPDRIESDPSALVCALDELEAARALVWPRAVAFAALRRRQKREGRRVPAILHPWDSWGCHAIAYCPEPRKYPAEPLPVVVGRALDAYAAGADPAGRCLICGDEDRGPHSACRVCGVRPGDRGNPL